MRRTTIVVMTVLFMVLGSTASYADSGATVGPRDDSGIASVRKATGKYHRLAVALADGFVAFSLDPSNPDVPTCFDSPTGGMGVHYVRHIDSIIDGNDPEALVYEVGRNGRLDLVAVEYIIPQEFVEDAGGNVVNLPELFGQSFHKHSFLPVYILHAWIWEANPSGMFADFNPRVNSCP